MNSKWITMVIAIVFVALAVSIPTGYVLLAEDPDEVKDTLWDRGSSEAKAFLAGDDEIALTVNGHPITVAEFLRAREADTTGRARVENTFSRVVPDDDPSIENKHWVNDCLECFAEYMDDPTKPLPKSYVELFPALELYLTYSVDSVALAGLLMDYTVYAAGVEAGYTMTDEEVQEVVDKAQFYYDNQGKTVSVPDPRTGEPSEALVAVDHERSAFIQTMGENEYWTKYLPETERRNGIAAKWRDAKYAPLYSRSATQDEILQVTWDYHVKLISDATVEFTGAIDIDATPEQALQFLLDKAKADGIELSSTESLSVDTK